MPDSVPPLWPGWVNKQEVLELLKGIWGKRLSGLTSQESKIEMTKIFQGYLASEL